MHYFPPKTGTNTRCLISPFLFNIVQELLANTIGDLKKLKAHIAGRKGQNINWTTTPAK